MSEIKSYKQTAPIGMIAILFIGAFVAILNEKLFNIALPSIMEEFEVNPTAVQWLSTGYMLINGILIPASAFFIQRFTDKKLFITAMSLFTLGTFLASIAPAFGVLLMARMIQAAGFCNYDAVINECYANRISSGKKRGRNGNLWPSHDYSSSDWPTLSGWVIEHYSWRMLFDIVLPIAIITLVLAIFKLKDVTPQRVIKLDIISLVLSSVGFGGLLYGFSLAGERGWGSPLVYGTIIIGAISLLTFVLRQLKVDDPMLEFRIFKYPMFALSSAISIVIAVAMFSAMILMPIYVQTIRGISPIDSGLLMLPGAIVMGIMSPITGKLFDKYGARTLALIGLTITIITSYYFSQITMDTAYSTLVWLYTFRMLGMSMVMMPVMTYGLNQLPAINNPHGTAMNNTLQQVSGAIGSALLITVMNNRTETKAEELAADAMAAVAVEQSAQPTAEMQQQLLHQAMLSGINFTFLISTLIAVVALILAIFIKRVKPDYEAEKLNQEGVVGPLSNVSES